jgi:hypothetical protein
MHIYRAMKSIDLFFTGYLKVAFLQKVLKKARYLQLGYLSMVLKMPAEVFGSS